MLRREKIPSLISARELASDIYRKVARYGHGELVDVEMRVMQSR